MHKDECVGSSQFHSATSAVVRKAWESLAFLTTGGLNPDLGNARAEARVQILIQAWIFQSFPTTF